MDSYAAEVLWSWLTGAGSGEGVEASWRRMTPMARAVRSELLTILEARDWLGWFLAAIARGELTVGSDLRAKLEGTVAALDALARESLAVPVGALLVGVRRQPDALVEARHRLGHALEEVRSGGLTASDRYVATLEAAVAALDALLGEAHGPGTA